MENSYHDRFNPQNSGFDEVSVQNSSSFFAKVMFFFGLALLVSASGTYTGFYFLGKIFFENPLLPMGLYVLELALVFTSRARIERRPLNYLLFALFAFTTGMTLAPLLLGIINEFGGPGIIVKALGASTMTFAAAAIFGWITQCSLSGLHGFLSMSLIGMIIVSILGIFIPWSNTFEIVFSGFGVILFAGYAMYDVQRLKNYPADRYIDAALQLYLNIFNLFLFILRLMVGNSRR